MTREIFQLANADTFADAPCTDAHPEDFFRYDRETHASFNQRLPLALNACRQCPIATKQRCLDIAMDAEGDAPGDLRHGIFGGLQPHERARLARKQREAS